MLATVGIVGSLTIRYRKHDFTHKIVSLTIHTISVNTGIDFRAAELLTHRSGKRIELNRKALKAERLESALRPALGGATLVLKLIGMQPMPI